MKNGIHELHPGDFMDLHDMYKDWGQIDDSIATVPDMYRYYQAHVKDAVKVVHNKVIVGAVWLDHLYPGFYASLNLIRNKRRPAAEFALYCDLVLDHFFRKHDLEKIIGVTWRREAILFARYFGFRYDGVIRHHARVEGEWKDFKLISILREEFYGKRAAGLGHGQAADDLRAAAGA